MRGTACSAVFTGLQSPQWLAFVSDECLNTRYLLLRQQFIHPFIRS